MDRQAQSKQHELLCKLHENNKIFEQLITNITYAQILVDSLEQQVSDTLEKEANLKQELKTLGTLVSDYNCEAAP